MSEIKRHDFIDHSLSVKYKEQAYWARFARDDQNNIIPGVYDISVCVMNGKPFLDSQKKLNDNISEICRDGQRRARHYESSRSDFIASYSAGTRNLYDKIGKDNIGYVAFSMRLDLTDLKKPIGDRISHFSISKDAVSISPNALSFDDVGVVWDDAPDMADEMERSYAAQRFAQDIREDGFVYHHAMRHTKGNHACTGNIFVAGMGFYMHAGFTKHAAQNNIPVLARLCEKSDNSCEEHEENYKTLKEVYEERAASLGKTTEKTLQEFYAEYGLICSVRSTTPMGDPIDAANLDQVLRHEDGERVVGEKETRKFAHFLNNEKQAYRLPVARPMKVS